MYFRKLMVHAYQRRRSPSDDEVLLDRLVQGDPDPGLHAEVLAFVRTKLSAGVDDKELLVAMARVTGALMKRVSPGLHFWIGARDP